MSWEEALVRAGGEYLKTVILRAEITPETLPRWSVAQVKRLPRMGDKRIAQLQAAAREVGVEWAPGYDPLAPKKLGRKPLPEGQRREWHLKITFTAEEWEQVQQEMKKHPTSSIAQEMRRRFFATP